MKYLQCMMVLVGVAGAMAAAGYAEESYGKTESYSKGGAQPSGYKGGRYYYGGHYAGKCGLDGMYWKDDTSFVICSNGNSYVQPCAPGTRNSGSNNYSPGYYYGYSDFCDVNLVDYGYGPAGYPHGQGYPTLNRGYGNGYGNGYGSGYGNGGRYGAYDGGYNRGGYGGYRGGAEPYGYGKGSDAGYGGSSYGYEESYDKKDNYGSKDSYAKKETYGSKDNYAAKKPYGGYAASNAKYEESKGYETGYKVTSNKH